MASKESWDICPVADESSSARYYLRNASQTLVTFSKRAKLTEFDIVSLFMEMEHRSVPFGYADSLRQIRFTSLSGKLGSYGNDEVFLHSLGDWGPKFQASLFQTFVHELGHHVDTLEAISDDHDVIEEKRHHSKFMPDPYSRKSVVEYVGCGFELFYFGSDEEKSYMRKMNKRLYRCIKKVHEKYAA